MVRLAMGGWPLRRSKSQPAPRQAEPVQIGVELRQPFSQRVLLAIAPHLEFDPQRRRLWPAVAQAESMRPVPMAYSRSSVPLPFTPGAEKPSSPAAPDS